MLQCGAPALSLSLSSGEQERTRWDQILLRHVLGMGHSHFGQRGTSKVLYVSASGAFPSKRPSLSKQL
jgi:hypothetical protein